MNASSQELASIDAFLSDISKDMSDDKLSEAVGGLVEEYLVFKDLRNTVDCFVAEEKVRSGAKEERKTRVGARDKRQCGMNNSVHNMTLVKKSSFATRFARRLTTTPRRRSRSASSPPSGTTPR